MRTYDVGAKVTCVAWNPNASLSLVAVTSARQLSVLNACVGDKLVVQAADNLVANIDLEKEKEERAEEEEEEHSAPPADWMKISSLKEEEREAFKNGLRLKVAFQHDVGRVSLLACSWAVDRVFVCACVWVCSRASLRFSILPISPARADLSHRDSFLLCPPR